MDRKNNFDFIRLLAATMVMYSHSFALSGHLEPGFAGNSLGGYGVWIFFSISGFLITGSYMRQNSIIKFMKARLLRIIPALVPLILLTVFLLGPILTTFELSDYFSHKLTWVYLKNIFPWKIYYRLPGVMDDHAINGSLWTLPAELKCYVAVGLLGLLGLLKYRWMGILLGVCGLLSMIYYSNFAASAIKITQMMFVAGAAYYFVWENIPRNRWMALGASVIWIVSVSYDHSGFVGPISFIFATYVILYLGFCKPLKLWNLTKWGDISYGVYIYAMPVQNVISYYHGWHMNPYLNFMYTMLIVFPLAWLSWHFVENKALKLK